ncbi:choice-of-anchor I family protein [Synechocystis sp. PCC 7339]|uniref:choice-of-anchor I family protein n=1 Tax=unclassified Synechocystis TaxID=2640012 RepID=UPI001BAE8C2C|nr:MULTISPECIES: choice-of-anchor I family protein [unclassified Synechocystis]QUS60010.1 5'-nucleotidase C-terminal domain-containing protein [Synechocystis sp. PCC 7338]UAJ72541.1 choice-of-anchor I family protein [Synechocystis sp. PCC 7339]
MTINNGVSLISKIGGFASSNGSEIPAFDPSTKRLFVVAGSVIEILDLTDPTNPTKLGDLALDFDGLPPGFSPAPNSVAVGKAGTPSAGIVAVSLAIRDDLNNQEAGQVQFFDTATGNFLGKVLVGFLPDMVAFSPDGTKVLTANEGEPNESYTVDPVGSVSIVDISNGFSNLVAQTATFDSFNTQKADLLAAGVRLFGQIFDENGNVVRNSTVAEDVEPEYIAFNGDGTKAWVTLQENNAVAVVDIASATVESILPLGFKDHSLPGNGLDASDRDGGINIQNWPIFGMYMPDSIASFTVGDQTYYITANEGDARNRPSDDDIFPSPFDGEGDIFLEEARIKDLILDPVAFPNAAELQADANLGRLTVTTKFGDIDGDGDFDQLYTYGSRSFSIWDSNGNLIYDSGDDFERIVAESIPDFFNASNNNNSFDNRSDNKGPEPEGVTVGTIDGRTYAFVGLERIGGVMVYEVTNPESPEFVQYVNPRDFTVDPESNLTDSGPEGLIFIDAADSPNGKPLLVVSNEVSQTTAIFEVNVPTPQPFTLQLFHAADQEGGVPALDDAPRFSAVLNALLQQDIDNDGIPGFANNLILSSGDAYIPGLFFGASQDVFGGAGRADILIQNELGFQAIAFGNHEFDLGTALIADLIGGDPADNFPGANFPYLSGNLDFTTDGNLSPLLTADGQESSTIPGKIAASTVITVNGEKIGIVGATTPTLRTIASPGDVGILPSPFGGTPTAEELDALAAIIQADVDALLLANPGLNKVVLLAHMQQISIEQELASRLSHVDIIVAGGSNARLVDENDRLRAGDTAQGIYPIIKTGADGNPVAVVNTDGNYKYVGRLVIDFDAEGVIIPESYDPLISGAYATDPQGVADLNAAGLVDQEIQAIVDQLREVIVAKESNVFGLSDVYLEGLRPAVRQQETNLGNLTADANLAIAKQTDPTALISLKNGGGIRDDIGRVVIPAGGTGMPERLPNEAVTDANGNVIKPEGGISETDIANALSFNNGLSLITVTAAELLALLEHGIAASDGTNQQGRFPQVSGIAFSFDLDRAPGNRILSLAIEDETGKDIDVLVKDGDLIGDPSRSFRMVTLGFLAGGGDGYPFPTGDSANRVDLNLPEDAPRTGFATFAPNGSEQDALAEYLAANFNTPATAFNQTDTTPVFDTRIQNLAFRVDTVIDALNPSNNDIKAVAQDGFFLVELPNGMEVSLKYEDQPLGADTFGNWQILEAETVAGINQVLWQNPDSNQFGLWNADANWNWISSETWATDSFNTLEAEVTFQIDLNNDLLLGDRLTNVETKGNVSLLEGIFGNYYAQTGDGLTTPLKYLGEAFDNDLGNWQALAAETVEGVNQVLWQNLDTNQIGVWNSSSDWNWLSSNVFAAGSPEAIAQANIFGVDLNGATVI